MFCWFYALARARGVFYGGLLATPMPRDCVSCTVWASGRADVRRVWPRWRPWVVIKEPQGLICVFWDTKTKS